MVTKVRGSKGFDALFSRVFDEPGLKGAVDNLQDGFSALGSKPATHTQPDSAAAVAVQDPVVAPVTIGRSTRSAVKEEITAPPKVGVSAVSVQGPVVAPITIDPPTPAAHVRPAVKEEIPATKKDTVPDVVPQVRLESPSDEVSERRAIDVLDEQTEELLIELAEVISQEQLIEQPPVPDESGDKSTDDGSHYTASPTKSALSSQTLVVSSVSDDVHDQIVVSFTNEHPPAVTPASPVAREQVTVSLKDSVPDIKEQGQAQGVSAHAKWTPLTEAEGKILVYLFEVAGGFTNVDVLGRELDIACHTVRDSLLVLVNEGYLYLLDKKKNSRNAPAGFTYTMNNYLCSRYVAGVRESVRLSQGQTLGVSIGRSAGLSDERPFGYSSRVVEKIEPAVTQPVLSGAVGVYWEKVGLKESQAQKWCSLFGVDAEQMCQQLEWARFDLEANKRRETVTKDVISWFYDRLMITGGVYPRPANYRSAAELHAEAMRLQREVALSAKAKRAEIEFENSLQSFLADPKAPLYQELLGRVNSFALEQLQAGEGRAAGVELEALFKVHWSMTCNESVTSTMSFALNGVGAAQQSPVGSVCGISDTRISLAAGWNLVGYTGVSSQPISHAIGSISSSIESIWGWSSGKWRSYGPARPVNSLTAFEPGMGYWINMKQPATWTLP